MYYYLKDIKNKIVCFNTNKEILKKTIPFLKHIQNFTEKDIIETTEELINRYNKDKKEMEICFLKDIEQEYLRDLKNKKIKELKYINTEHINSKYSVETQIDIVAGIEPQLSIEDMRTYISTSINSYNTTLWRINACKTVEELRKFDIQKDYNDNLKNKELQTNTKLEEEEIQKLLK